MKLSIFPCLLFHYLPFCEKFQKINSVLTLFLFFKHTIQELTSISSLTEAPRMSNSCWKGACMLFSKLHFKRRYQPALYGSFCDLLLLPGKLERIGSSTQCCALDCICCRLSTILMAAPDLANELGECCLLGVLDRDESWRTVINAKSRVSCGLSGIPRTQYHNVCVIVFAVVPGSCHMSHCMWRVKPILKFSTQLSPQTMSLDGCPLKWGWVSFFLLFTSFMNLNSR